MFSDMCGSVQWGWDGGHFRTNINKCERWVTSGQKIGERRGLRSAQWAARSGQKRGRRSLLRAANYALERTWFIPPESSAQLRHPRECQEINPVPSPRRNDGERGAGVRGR